MSVGFEKQLKELLARAAQAHRPGDALGRIEALARLDRRLRRVRLMTVTVLVLGALVGVGVVVGRATGGGQRVSTALPAPATTPAVTRAPEASFCATGATGRYAWAVTGTRLFVTADQGRHWSSTPLPVACPAVAEGSGVWWLLVARGDSPTVSFYRTSVLGGSWRESTVELRWPPKAPQGPLSGAFGSEAPGTISVLLTEGGAQTGPVGLGLVSGDGGRTFQQYDPPTLFGEWQSAFSSPTHGVLVGFISSGQVVYYTTDGGTSWIPTRLPGLPADASLGSPVVDGTRIFITANGAGDDLLYRSDDGGVTFTLQRSIWLPAETNPPVIAVEGNEVWLAPEEEGGEVFESSSAGDTWRKVSAPSLTGPGTETSWLDAMSLSGSKDASAWISIGSAGQSEVFLSTTNRGHSWHRVSVPKVDTHPATK